jgi:cytochrome o ubiquinol oxidase subunit 1
MPFYNYARIPRVEARDAFWDAKEKGSAVAEGPYEDVELPKDSWVGVALGAGAFAFGFAFVWHIWWLVLAALLVMLGVFFARLLDEDTEYVIPAAEIARLDSASV